MTRVRTQETEHTASITFPNHGLKPKEAKVVDDWLLANGGAGTLSVCASHETITLFLMRPDVAVAQTIFHMKAGAFAHEQLQGGVQVAGQGGPRGVRP